MREQEKEAGKTAGQDSSGVQPRPRLRSVPLDPSEPLTAKILQEAFVIQGRNFEAFLQESLAAHEVTVTRIVKESQTFTHGTLMRHIEVQSQESAEREKEHLDLRLKIAGDLKARKSADKVLEDKQAEGSAQISMLQRAVVALTDKRTIGGMSATMIFLIIHLLLTR